MCGIKKIRARPLPQTRDFPRYVRGKPKWLQEPDGLVFGKRAENLDTVKAATDCNS
jgi:hypothetical protein